MLHPEDSREQTFACNLILRKASRSTEAIAEIYRYRKEHDRKVSLQYLCRKASVPSTGYLSDVMNGKRVLNRKYKDSLGRALGLSVLQTQYLSLLVDLDHAENASERDELAAAVERFKTLLPTELKSIPLDMNEDIFFHLVVFSSFALLGGRPTLADLQTFFGKSLNDRLELSLVKLLNAKLIEEHDSRYSIAESRVIFQQSENGFSHLDFLQSALDEVRKKLEYWYGRRSESVVLSSLITTRREHYKEKLPSIKAQISTLLQELDCEAGDMILLFNTHIFPYEGR